MKDRDVLESIGVIKQAPVLVAETDWSRKYLVGPKSIYYESKFVTDGLRIDPTQLANRWTSLSESQRLDFALAFGSKREVSSSDEDILNFLMQAGNEVVWRTISLMLTRHSNRDTVVTFIIERIRRSTGMKANYYQAAEIMADPRFIPVLEHELKTKRESVSPPLGASEFSDLSSCFDLLNLYAALLKLTRKTEYTESIRSMLDHPSPLIQNHAKMRLHEPG